MLRRRTFVGLDEEKANIPDRGDVFLSHVYHICQSEKIQDLLTLFRTRTAYYDMDKDWRFYRVLSHWDSKGLIECERESMDGWRKFNLVEALWVSVIQRLRHLNTSLEDIGHLKEDFFETIDWECPISLAEYYALCAVFLEKPTFLVVAAPCWSDFFSYEELQTALAKTRFESCIIVHLNPLLNKLLPKEGSNLASPLQAGLPTSSKKFSRFLQKRTLTELLLEKRKARSIDAILKRDLRLISLNMYSSKDTRI
jgi:DNA-binding transcriptional MerR regulator